MKLSVEFLYHVGCENCNKWFTVGDLHVFETDTLRCPHCDSISSINVMGALQKAVTKAQINEETKPKFGRV